jgi:LysM repeat protein
MLKSFKISLLVIVFHASAFAGNILLGEAAKKYIQNFKSDAVKEMLMYNIPASITLAQGMLESGYGLSDLAVYANNHFGIKCHEEWHGPTFIKTDDAKDECFRKYPSVLDSYTDHSLFLRSRPRYASLFELKTTDYKGWANGLKEAGYATDPKYVRRLLELIETYELYKYDKPNQNKEIDAIKNVPTQKTVKPSNSEHIESTTALAEKKSVAKLETNQPREILHSGIIKYIIIKPNDTFLKVSKDLDKDLWQLYKFNDLSPDDKLIPGQKLYLQPKRRKAKEPFHIVQKGETMKSISQLYNIKLKSLYKKNRMKETDEPTPGQQLYMRHRKK